MLNTTIPIVATIYLETFKVLKQRRSKHTKIMLNHVKLKLGIMMKGFCLKLVGFKESCYSGKKGHRSVSFWERNSKLSRWTIAAEGEASKFRDAKDSNEGWGALVDVMVL